MKQLFGDVRYVYSSLALCLFCHISLTVHGFSGRDKEERGLFAPRMDYEEWTPIGRGDPLKNDPTFDYVPPVLDKVHYWINPSARTSEPPIVSESQIMTLGTPATKKLPHSPLKPIIKSDVKRYHTDNKRDHYQGYGPYTNAKHSNNRGQRPQYIPLGHYHSTYKYPRPPLTMLVPPPPSQPVTYPSTTEEEYSNQITTDLPNWSQDKTQAPSTTLSLPTGVSWKTSLSPETTQQLQTTTVFQITNQDNTNTVYYDPVKKETIYKLVSPTIDIDTTGQTAATGLVSVEQSTAGQTTSQGLSSGSSLTTTGQIATAGLTTAGRPFSIDQGQTTVRQPSSFAQTTAAQPSTMGEFSSLFDLLLKQDSPTAVTATSTATMSSTVRPTISTPAPFSSNFLPHYKPPQESSKAPMYLIIQGHSKVKKYGATKLDKVSGIPLQDSNEISSHQESDSNEILKRKTRDINFEDFLPFDSNYLKSTFEEYYDNQYESSGLGAEFPSNAIPTR